MEKDTKKQNLPKGMTRAVFYKEWLKTRWYYAVSALVVAGFTAYCLMRVSRVVTLKGPEHIWEILISRDTVFIEPIRYVFLAVGIGMAVFQFVPEMSLKRLKLTLHLPCSGRRMTLAMLAFGVLLLAGLYAASDIALWCYLWPDFAPELVEKIMLTGLTWQLAGLAGYLLCAWTVLEPSWKARIGAILLSAAVLRVFFISPYPQAYDSFLAPLAVFTLLAGGFSWLSVCRFKAGVQD